MNAQDTIAAISSAVGAGARIVVRLSGAQAHRIVREVSSADEVTPGGAAPTSIFPGVIGWIYTFVGPRSYTGDDSAEFHIPGSPVLARMLLDEVVRRGARQAEPGEFTARAYFNGRIDLTQAEGVAATIAATSARELRAARQLLGGELARRLTPVMDNVAQALALVEVSIDFSDEDVTFLSADDVRARCKTASEQLGRLSDESARFERLGHEPRVVLVGRPNAGKSTLLNALAGHERAVVSNVAGTTRDAIWAEVRLARGRVRVVDVAGLEENFEPRDGISAEESIAAQMREQALREVRTADVVVGVVDGTSAVAPVEVGRALDLVVRTKADLEDAVGKAHPTEIAVSAKTGAGIGVLCERLDALAFGGDTSGSGLALNARHVRAIGEAREALARAAAAVEAGAEVVALELREALDALGSVLGKMSPDDLLGRIFSGFCIGK
jgi:tRNA modification GTPase